MADWFSTNFNRGRHSGLQQLLQSPGLKFPCLVQKQQE
jgi:hypothetical protein